MTQRRWLVGGLVVLLASMFSYWLYTHLEQREVTVTTPPSGEAIRNPLLAAERLMKTLSQDVESQRGSELLSALPANDDVLLIYHHNTPLTQPKRDAVLDWVASGGHLIFDVAKLWSRQREQAVSPLLDYLEVEVEEQLSSDNQPTEIYFDDADEPVRVRFKQDLRLHDKGRQASAWIGNDNSAYMLQFDHGQGLITVINDLRVLDNDHIGQHEHAYFFYQLANTNGKLWLLYDPFRKSLFAILLEKAPAFLLTLLLLALVWVWHGARRIAPLQTLSDGQRRDVTEHVKAVAEFEWRYGQLPARYRLTQKHIEQGWLARHPQLQPMPAKQRARWIAELAGEDQAEVYLALYEMYADDPDFIRRSALLARLRRWT